MNSRILMALLSSLCVSAPAADRYVRAGASGNGTGTDWVNAYAALPATLIRGDTYYLADGNYGSQTFDDPVSGSLPITIRKATVADHGTATGWSAAYGDGSATFGSSIEFLTSNWIFDGRRRADETSGHGFRIDNTASTATELCRFGQYGMPITNITVRHTAFLGRGYGQSAVFDRVFYSNSPGTSNITLQYNYVLGPYVHLLTRQLSGMLVEHNYFADNNSRPESHAEFWSDCGTDNVTCRFNKIRNPEGSAVIFIGNGDGSSPDASNTSSNWLIHGNTLFYRNYSTANGNNAGTAGIVYCANDSSNRNWCNGWKIYNNTFHDFSHGTASARIFVQSSSGVTVPVVQNNLWNACGDGAPHLNISASFNYYRDTVHPLEAHEQLGINDPFISSASGDFHLAAATAAGATLPAAYAVDADGRGRGGDGTWDRGAYEFSNSPTTTPPTIATPAHGPGAAITGTTAALGALGGPAGSESAYTYTWNVVSSPAGGTATFSPNGSNAARNTTTTFTRAGTYQVQVAIANPTNGTTTISGPVTLTVNATFTSILVTGPATVVVNGSAQFSAQGRDQFAQALAVQPSFTWSASSGSVTNAGLFTAAGTTGTHQVTAANGGKNGHADVAVTTAGTGDSSTASGKKCGIGGGLAAMLLGLGVAAGLQRRRCWRD